MPAGPPRQLPEPVLRFWRAQSLARRITAAATALVGVTLALSAVLLVSSLRAGLIGAADAAAEQRAADLVQLVSTGVPPALLPQAGDQSGAQVLDQSGQVVSSTPQLSGAAPLLDLSTVGAGIVEAGDARLLVVPAPPYTVVVASPLDEVREVTTRLSLALVVGVPLLLVVLAGLISALVRYALRTVDRMRRQVDAITATDLHRRLELPSAHDEVHALAETMNALLARLEEAAAVQRRFVADAAHELRSPLASLHAQLEVGMRHPDPARFAARLPALLSDTARLARLVDDLLALARLDESARPHRSELVDLDEVVYTQVAALRPAARVPLRTAHVSAGLVRGDPDLLTRVVRNLLDNAVRHAATTVDVSLGSTGDVVELVVQDDGPGIPAADAERVFHRFERLQDARDRDSGGSGLGLAIVHDVVALSGGTVEVAPSGSGARLVVRLPAADQDAPVVVRR